MQETRDMGSAWQKPCPGSRMVEAGGLAPQHHPAALRRLDGPTDRLPVDPDRHGDGPDSLSRLPAADHLVYQHHVDLPERHGRPPAAGGDGAAGAGWSLDRGPGGVPGSWRGGVLVVPLRWPVTPLVLCVVVHRTRFLYSAWTDGGKGVREIVETESDHD